MDDDKKEVKEYFQINLDTARIFWISFIFSLILIGVFLLGFYSAGGRLNEFFGSVEKKEVKTEQAPAEKQVVEGVPEEKKTEDQKTDEELIRLLSDGFKAKTKVVDVEGVVSEKGAHVTGRVSESTTGAEYTREPAHVSITTETRTKKTTSPAKEVSPISRYVYRPIGDYYIQVASFTRRENAEKFAEKLKRDKYRVEIIEADIEGKKFYRVRVGPFEKKSIARNTMIAMKRIYSLTDSYVVKKK